MALSTISSHSPNWRGAGEAMKGPLHHHPRQCMDCGDHHPQHGGFLLRSLLLFWGIKLKCGSVSLRLDIVFPYLLLFCFLPSALLLFSSEEWRSYSLVFFFFFYYIIPLEVLIESWKTTLFEHVYGGNQTRLPLWFAFSYFMLPAFSCGFH